MNEVSHRLVALWAAAIATGPVFAADSLAELIRDGERVAALEAIAGGADVNAAEGDGTTPLHWAVYTLDYELTETLLRHGASPDAVNAFGSSPLAEAVKVADVELVRMLLESGADAETPNVDGQTALMLSARAGSLEVARLLIDDGANVNARETWRDQTVLMWAADANFPELVHLLIERGADVDTRGAATQWRSQITSEPRAQYRPTGGLTPLLYAARSGCSGCVEAILDAGAAIDRPNPDGVTPLMVAIDNFRFDTAALLLERGANPHIWDWWGRTPLYVAVDMNTFSSPLNRRPEEGSRSAIDIIAMLLSAGVNPNPQLNMHRPGRGGNSSRFVDDLLTTGATPLLRAAIAHDVDAARLLLEHGALVDLPNVMGVTPLMGAAGMGVSPRDRRLDYSGDVQRRSIAMLDLLLSAGADINARVTDISSRTARIARPSSMSERAGQSALYGAVKWAWTDVVKFLLEHGADVDIVDALGHSPKDAALGQIGGRDNTVSQVIADMLAQAANGEA